MKLYRPPGSRRTRVVGALAAGTALIVNPDLRAARRATESECLERHRDAERRPDHGDQYRVNGQLGSTTWGFQASTTAPGGAPTGFTLDGTACSSG
jgi:hypothetical protein